MILSACVLKKAKAFDMLVSIPLGLIGLSGSCIGGGSIKKTSLVLSVDTHLCIGVG